MIFKYYFPWGNTERNSISFLKLFKVMIILQNKPLSTAFIVSMNYSISDVIIQGGYTAVKLIAFFALF